MSNSTGAELLSAAICANDVAVARSVFEKHPEVKATLNDPMPGGHFGATPLLMAVNSGNKEMAALLLDQGADVNARSQWWAGSFGVLDSGSELTSFLIERGATVDAHAAARLGRLDRLKELVTQHSQVVHARGGDGQTPLHFASTVEVADFLIDHGADINALDVDHESTPAQWMIRERTEIARHLVKRRARADFLMACALGDLERVKTMLREKPECIRMTVSREWFPMKNLHAGGTIYQWTLGQNKTPHRVAYDFGHTDVAQFLMAQSSEEMQLAQACELGDEETFKRLLAKNPGFVAKLSKEEQRKLPDAVRDKNLAAVHLMLDAGWPLDARGQHGGTALHWACWQGHVELVRLVLGYNPPLELRDHDYQATPLGWAIHGSTNCGAGDYGAVVAAVLQAGAKFPEPDARHQASDAVAAVLEKFRPKS